MRLCWPTLALTVGLLAPGSASAVQGNTPYQSIPQTRTHRIAVPAVQKRLSSSDRWQDFLERRGGTWRVSWDEATGTPVRFSGTGWHVGAEQLAKDSRAWAIGDAILAEEHALLGGKEIALSDLKPWVVDRSAGITTITYRRTWQGLPVLGARVSLRFKAGRFVMAQFESMPGVGVPRTARVSAQLAQATAVEAMGWKAGDYEVAAAPELVVLPLLGRQNRSYRLTWSLSLWADSFPSHRKALVDATNGEFLGWREQLRFMGGQVVAEHDNRYPGNGLMTSAMAHAELTGAGSSAEADQTGLFSLATSGPVELHWSAGSEWFDIRALDSHGRAVFTADFNADGDILLASADESLSSRDYRRELAQIDAHISAHIVRERALTIRPNFPWAQEMVITRVNSDESRCNAWFDEESTLNFVIQGEGCNNTARIADVIYHEYGHGFHIWNIIPGAGGWGDGSLGEGLSDYMSSTITGTPNMAPGFFRQTNAPLRYLDNDARWPEDIEEDPHATGLIVGGALWHLREALVAEYGEEDGVQHGDFLYWQATRRANDIPTVYDEILLADDDNGDLADGTPNQCIIDEAFGRHGLAGISAPGGGQISHQSPADLPEPGEDVELDVITTLASLNCLDSSIGSVLLSYSYDSGSDVEDFVRAQMQEADEPGRYIGTLPAPPPSQPIRYFIEVFSDTEELLAQLPGGSRSDPWYELWTGPAEVVFESDFEDNDGGFTHDLLSDSEQLGADDWQWGAPNGAEGDPIGAFSGTRVWGNDLALESNWNGAYQANVHNLLRSPDIELPARAAGDRMYVQFRRWLNVEDGFFDQAIFSVNGEEVWSQHASPEAEGADLHHRDSHWALRSYDVTQWVSDSDSLQMEWQIIADGGLELGGWTLDDVRVLLVPAEEDTSGGDDDDDQETTSRNNNAGMLSASGCSCDAGATNIRPGFALLTLLLFSMVPRRRRRSSAE
jgi:hypothetical protein